MDGKPHYVRLEGAPCMKRQGLYRGYLDDWPAGFIKNYKSGYKRNWKVQADAVHVTMSRAEQADMARKDKATLDQRRAEKLAEDAKTAAEARAMLGLASPA